jgi:hypothetical protein
MYIDKMRDFGFIPANHQTPNFFPVSLVDIQTPDGVAVPGYKAVQRQDTLDVLAVHSDGYKLVSHEAVTAAFDDAVGTLDTTGMMVGSDLTHNGGRLFRQYILPAYRVETAEGDATALRIIAFNSYDGSAAINFRAGTYRFVCANTSIIGTDIAAVRRRHTANLVVKDIAEGMVEACLTYAQQMDRMKRWVGVPVEMNQIIKIFQTLPGSNNALVGILLDNLLNRPEADQGDDLWGLYNVLTSWASHTERRSPNAFASRIAREERVAKLIDGTVWRSLEDAP